MQEQQDLKGLTIILRCHLHSAQRSFENSLKSEGRVNQLLETLVLAASPASESKDLGGLARGIRNSTKLSGMLKDCLSSAEACDAAMGSLHAAPQRFDSIMLVVTTLAEHVKPILECLHLFRVHAPKLRQWVARMTACFSAPNVILLALLAELSATCMNLGFRRCGRCFCSAG